MKSKNNGHSPIAKLLSKDPLMRVKIDESSGVLEYARGKLDKLKSDSFNDLNTLSRDFIEQYKPLFGDVTLADIQPVLENEDVNGGKTIVYQQYFGKIRVEGGSIRFHSSDNVLDTIDNKLFRNLAKLPSKNRVTSESAIKTAQKTVKVKEAPEKKPELLVIEYDKRNLLAWKIELREKRSSKREAQKKESPSKIVSVLTHQHGGPSIWIVYVNAVDGKVIFYYDNLQTAGPVVGNGTGYYSGAGSVHAYFNDLTYQLRDLSRVSSGGPEIRTDDEDGSSPSEDADNDWNTLSTAPRESNQGAEVDAHRYTGNVVDYFRTVHGRNSFDGASGMLRIVTHLGTDYSNGYWDGTQVNLGDGSGVASTGDDYECSDDWLAHEWTHAYTQYTCGLNYLNESGALNEAFSDIMAAFITGDWLVFEDAWLKVSAPAWRNMIDPTNGGLWDPANAITSVLAGHQPSHYTVRYTGGWDNGGVHVNSGIINNLFYLLTVGGTHTVSGITVSGVGQSPAEQMLWRCMSVNLVGNPNATFLDFRRAMLDACLDLFPTDLNMLTQVKNAFHAVGIGPDLFVRDNVADTGSEPYTGSYLWASPDVINRKNLSADPAVEFANLAIDSYWENVEFGQPNYVYVRVQNRGASEGSATVNVYFSSATTFGTPASWIHIGTQLVSNIAAGTMKIAGPITFPQALIPTPGHYCMIAVISDPLDPAPDHTLITSVSQYLQFVQHTNNIAYRNMDVENEIMDGAPGTYSVDIRGLEGAREYFDIDIDLRRFVPGARVLVKIDRKHVLGAKTKGLKLIGVEKNRNVYEVLIGKNYQRNRLFIGKGDKPYELEYGFGNVLVDKAFPIEIVYHLRDNIQIPEKNFRGYELAVRQKWNGEAIGGAGVRLQFSKGDKKIPKVIKVPKARMLEKVMEY
jgi:bacillolysin